MPTRSLKARAIHWLSGREHSRLELRRKLLPHAMADAMADAVANAVANFGTNPAERSLVDGLATATFACGASVPVPLPRADEPAGPEAAPADPPAASASARVEALLDWLEANGYLSDARFIESRVQVRASRFGNLRIRRELKAHRLVLSVEALRLLQTSELSRARALYARRFADPPADGAERARRARFLSGRGFSFDVISRVLDQRSGHDEPG